jgi:hypothetical protein
MNDAYCNFYGVPFTAFNEQLTVLPPPLPKF